MATLSNSDWLKYEYRIPLLIEKLKTFSEFTVEGAGKIVFSANPHAIAEIESRVPTRMSKVRLVDSKTGREYGISKIVKTAEFGGKADKGVGGTAKEDAQLAALRAAIDEAKAAEKSSTILIRVKNKTHVVFDAASTHGTPKSDFHLLSEDGKEICWISHKDGRTARDFQQWGGMTEKSEPKIFYHPETQEFLKDLRVAYPKGMPSGPTVFRKIKDKKLKMLSVYGNNYGGLEGQQNVSLMLQGAVSLKKHGNLYVIDAYHVHYNGDEMTGTYEPVLTAKYTSGRQFGGLQNTRALVLPEGSRKMIPFPGK